MSWPSSHLANASTCRIDRTRGTNPVRSLGRNAPLIWLFDFGAIILFACLYRMLPHLSFFLHFFLTYLLSYLSFQNWPALYEAGCRKRQLNLLLVFLCLFCALMLFFWSVSACFCCVRFSFFYTKSRNWLGKTSLKWTVSCRVGCKTTAQSVISDQLAISLWFSFAWRVL